MTKKQTPIVEVPDGREPIVCPVWCDHHDVRTESVLHFGEDLVVTGFEQDIRVGIARTLTPAGDPPVGESGEVLIDIDGPTLTPDQIHVLIGHLHRLLADATQLRGEGTGSELPVNPGGRESASILAGPTTRERLSVEPLDCPSWCEGDSRRCLGEHSTGAHYLATSAGLPRVDHMRGTYFPSIGVAVRKLDPEPPYVVLYIGGPNDEAEVDMWPVEAEDLVATLLKSIEVARPNE